MRPIAISLSPNTGNQDVKSALKFFFTPLSIVQHTFGIPTDMEKILALAKKHKLFIVEDCAHTIGGELKNKKLGTFGDASFFSLGRDKAFSSVFGGMAITNSKKTGERLMTFQ